MVVKYGNRKVTGAKTKRSGEHLGIIETFTRLQRPEREAASDTEIQIA